jgi:hypothetical protein
MIVLLKKLICLLSQTALGFVFRPQVCFSSRPFRDFPQDADRRSGL